jgi:adenylate cyclase
MRAGVLRGRKAIWLAIVSFAAVLAGIASWQANAFQPLELHSVDQRFSIRGPKEAPEDIVIVDIDDRTFTELGEQWPFPRSIHGRVIDRLRKAGAKVVAFDVQFTEPTEPREDNALIRAVARMGRMVLSTTEVAGDGRTNVLGGDEVLRQSDARAGNTVVETDPGGTIRRMLHTIDGLTSFPVATAEEVSKGAIDKNTFPDDRSAWIDYRGPPGTVRTVSYSQVILGRIPDRVFRGKTVVIGSSAPTLQDVHSTPTSGEDLMSGPELNANAIWTALNGFPLRPSSDILDIMLIILLSVTAPALMLRFGPLPSIGLSLMAGIAYLAVIQFAFNQGTILPVVYPMVGLMVAGVGALAVSYVDSAFERQRVRDTFARFVPESVVSDVLERADDDLRLGGVRRDCTVLFCDLRGFTKFAEGLEPDLVIGVLNRYLGLMSDEIMEQGGTLVAYMGDGIMAVFGAPIQQADHADRALLAARRMLKQKLPEFNAWVREQALGDDFEIGIGLHSGEVMSGQVGSERRIEYAAIGDTTNTAARLEEMTKVTPHSLLFSEATRRTLGRVPDDIEEVGTRAIRGRDEKILLWTLAVNSEPPAGLTP